MLNKRITSLFFLGAVFLGSCTQKVSDTPLYGLIEGTYYYKSHEGIIPDGWSFSDDSYFEFKRNDSGEYSKHDWLPNGEWSMQKYTPIDETHYSLIPFEYVMKWYNTPFDSLDSLQPRGTSSAADNTACFPMYAKNDKLSSTKEVDSNWKGIINVECYITPLQRNDYSKRKLMVKCYYSDLSNFSITFSM